MAGLRSDRALLLDALIHIAGHAYDPAACNAACAGQMQRDADAALANFFGREDWTYDDVERMKAV